MHTHTYECMYVTNSRCVKGRLFFIHCKIISDTSVTILTGYLFYMAFSDWIFIAAGYIFIITVSRCLL